MKGLRLSIKARLMLYISLLVLLLIGGTSLFSYFSLRQVVGDGVAREAQAVTEKNAEVMSQWFKSIEDELYLFSSVPAVRGFDLDEARALMAALMANRPEYGGILLADLTGEATTVEGLTINIAARDYFSGALGTEKIYYSEPMITQGLM